MGKIILHTADIVGKMGLVDLSYTFSADDQSNWPGNQVFTKTVVSQGDDNPMSCFIAHVSDKHCCLFSNCLYPVQPLHERACGDSHGRSFSFQSQGLDN